jgi:leucyl/phenylalanyl-tRNA---protein transferase
MEEREISARARDALWLDSASMRRRRRPLLIAPGGPIAFPDPETADDEGLLALGGDLSVPRLLAAYDHGIFPWYDEGLPPLWWSPDPRAVMDPQSLHVSRSLRRELRRGRFAVTFDRDFCRVMRECGRQRQGGTWILPEMLAAYTALHRAGHAHSFEVWEGDELVGGLYGVHRGGLFAAESMFHRVNDASKIALVVSVESLFRAGISLYDVQFSTPHLESLGAHAISRVHYLERLRAARDQPVTLERLDLAIK